MSAGPWKRHSQSPRHCSWLWPRMLRPAGCKQRQRVQLPEGPQFCILLRGPQTKNGSPAGQTKVIHRREAERERRSLSPWRAAGSTDIIVAWDPLSFDYNIKEMEIFVSAMVTKVSLLHPAKPTFRVQSLGWENLPEKGMETHSNIFAWEMQGQRRLAS